MQKNCKHCQKSLPEIALVNQVDVIICEHCHAVNYMNLKEIPLPDNNADDLTPLSEYPEKVKSKPQKFKPRQVDNVKIERIPKGFEIVYVWLSFEHLLMATLVFVFTMLALWGALRSDWEQVPREDIISMIPFVIIFISLGYYALVGYTNKTSIKIFKQQIEIKHGPLFVPGKGKRIIDRANIRQVYCIRRKRLSSRNDTYHYDLHYIAKDGSDIRLISGFLLLRQAVFIEQQIERLYHIENLPVYGEYPDRLS